MNKRIAVQFYGHLRSFEKTYKAFVKYVVEEQKRKNNYEVDVFIHTWAETDHSSIAYHNLNGEKRGGVVDNDIIQKVKKYYNPKELLVEE
jgi:hypothetical protein